MRCTAGSTAFGIVLGCLSAGCGGEVIRLGEAPPPTYHFDAPVLVAELATSDRNDNPTLTADRLEIYFTSNRRPKGRGDVWFAKRASVDLPFGISELVDGVNSDSFETSSAISADGLSLWFGSDRPGGLGGIDIWVAQRASRTAPWSAPANVEELNTSSDEIPRPPGFHDLIMPLASLKSTESKPVAINYQTYFAERRVPSEPWSPPAAIPELNFGDRSTVDAFLTEDGLTLLFSSLPLPPATGDGGAPIDAAAAAAKSDLFVAFRRSVNEAFGAPVPLGDLNTEADERDPWLSPDGHTLYFVSDRGGELAIYTAAVHLVR